jgi:hypothetical protein
MLAKNALVLTFGALTGCVAPGVGGAPLAGSPPAWPVAGSKAAAHVDENLARLQALDVFIVGRLVVDVAAAPTSCSGPCPGAEAAFNAAHSKSATRLAQLAAVAEKAAAFPFPDGCEQSAIDENLAALSALRIVRVSGLVVPPPANDPQCHDKPCPADGAAAAAAAAAMCARAGKLAAIVAAAKGL